MTLTPEQKARMVEAEKLNIQLESVERRLQGLARSRTEARDLLAALDQMPSIVEGDELLVPLATGIFVRAKARAGSGFFLNVGDGVVVEKSAQDVRAMVTSQLERIDAQETALQAQFEIGLEHLDELRESFAPKEE